MKKLSRRQDGSRYFSTVAETVGAAGDGGVGGFLAGGCFAGATVDFFCGDDAGNAWDDVARRSLEIGVSRNRVPIAARAPTIAAHAAFSSIKDCSRQHGLISSRERQFRGVLSRPADWSYDHATQLRFARFDLAQVGLCTCRASEREAGPQRTNSEILLTHHRSNPGFSRQYILCFSVQSHKAQSHPSTPIPTEGAYNFNNESRPTPTLLIQPSAPAGSRVIPRNGAVRALIVGLCGSGIGDCAPSRHVIPCNSMSFAFELLNGACRALMIESSMRRRAKPKGEASNLSLRVKESEQLYLVRPRSDDTSVAGNGFDKGGNGLRKTGRVVRNGRPTTDLVLSAYLDTNDAVFRQILKLYAKPGSTIADVTYGRGVFWRSVPPQLYRLRATDLQEGVDCRDLPYRSGSIDCVVLDPPYMHTPGGSAHTSTHAAFEKHYRNNGSGNQTASKYHEAVLDLYRDAGHEAHRVLKTRGVFIVKCQDEVCANRQRFTHIEIIQMYERIGFIAEDLFVILRRNRPGVSRMVRQVHARKNHSYFLVFWKRAGGNDRWEPPE